MPICKFYQNGNCKNGNRCRFDHVKIDDGRNQPSQDRYNEPRGNAFNQPSRDNRNHFDSAIRQPEPRGYNDQSRGGNSQGRGNDRPGRTPDYASGPRAGRFFIDEALTRYDLVEDRPQWPLSCYSGAGQGCTDTPRHLIGGVIEQSPEEVRTAFYLAKLNGQEQAAQQTEQVAAQAANAEVEKVINNMQSAISYAVNGKREPGSRWDIVEESNKQTPNQNRGIFARGTRPTQAAPASSGGFGAPSAPSGFGQPSASSSFGQASAPSAFGQPSAPSTFGQPSAPSAFGQPSALASTSAFGRPSAPPQSSGFGQPSQLGQASAFGKPTAPGAFGASSGGFGQPSALGQNPSPFGKPSPMGQASAFGQPSNLTQNSMATNRPQVPGFGSTTPFGQASSTGSPFGQPSNQPASTFGQPSAPAQNSPFAAQAPAASPFGQPSAPQQNASPFGQPAQTQPSPFGQPSQPPTQSMFGAPQPPSSAFGQQPNAFNQPPAPAARSFGQQQPNPFNNPTPQQQNNGFGAPKPSALPSLHTTQPALSSGPLDLEPYNPHAPPRPEDPPEELYEGNKAKFEEEFRYVRENGTFKDGIMPEVAPMHYWVGWGQQEKRFKS